MRIKSPLTVALAIFLAGCAKVSDTDAISSRTTTLEQEMAQLAGRIQSIVVVPDYDDGSAMYNPEQKSTIRFEISPVSAIKDIIGADGSTAFFSVDVTAADTKASSLLSLEIDSIIMDENDEFVLVTLNPATSIPSTAILQARLKIEALKDQAGYVCKTSSYFPLYIEKIERKDFVHQCNDLVFVPALAPINGKDGCIAHWHCPDCNKNYLDQAGTKELNGLPFLPSKVHSIPLKVLRNCNDFLPWKGEAETTKAAKAVLGKILGIVNKVVTISFQIETRTSLDDFAKEFGNICSELGSIKQELDELNSKINNILSYIDVYDDKETVQTVYDYLTTLAPKTLSYLETFEKYTEEYNNGERTEESYRNVLLGGVRMWAEESTVRGTLKEMTEELMRIFVYNLRDTKGEAFPKVLKDYVNFYRLWDDEGYDDRVQFLRYYETVVAVSELLCQIYVNDCKEYIDDYYRIQDSTSLAKSFEEFPSRISADSTNIVKAYGLYRCFHDNDVTFRLDPQVRSASIYDYFESHFDDANFVMDNREHMDDRLLDFMAEKLVGGLTQADLLSSTQFITDDDVNRIYSTAQTEGSKTLTEIFAERGMNMNPYSLAEPLIFTWRRNESLHDYSDVAGSTFHNWAEGYGFEMDHQAENHLWYWSYDKDHYGHYCTENSYLWADYCHDDYNNVPKHTDSDDDNLRLTVIRNFYWTGWPNSENCYTCDHARIYRSMGNDIDSRAKYQVTFRYYQGTEIPD